METFSKSDEFLFRIHQTIERGRIFPLFVLGSATSPSWAYTIGLTEHGHPELVTIGLDAESTDNFLRRAVDETLDGVPLDLGRAHHRTWDTTSGVDLHIGFVAVPTMLWARPSNLVGVLHAYYRSRGGFPCEPRVAQLVWPDMDGRLPWEAGFDASLRRCQPLLDQERWMPPIPDDDGVCCECCDLHEEGPPNRAARRRRRHR